MLTRIVQPNGVALWRSDLLAAAGTPHAFSTRLGGVSRGPFTSLNLGNPGGAAERDSDENLRENYFRLQVALGLPLATRAWVTQVHGRMVELVEAEGEGEYAETLEAEIRDRYQGQLPADALVTAQKNVLLTIRVADCFPILLAGDDGRIVGAAHAGWRGVIGNIVGKTVRTMHEAGGAAAAPAKLIAAIGPGICADCFEVGQEVAEQFDKAGHGASVLRPSGRKPHVDLRAVLAAQLLAAGVTRVDSQKLCTVEYAADFYSHRRDQGLTGRLAAVIAPNPAG
jgi:polyphenol oxidase